MTDRADKADVERIVWNVKNEKDAVLLDHYGVLLNLVVEKNPQFLELVKGEMTMKEVLMEMVKDEVDKKVQEASRKASQEANRKASQEASQETKVIDIRNLMDNLKFTAEQAMDALNIPQNDRATYTVLVKKKS